jgi:hypothetical protein
MDTDSYLISSPALKLLFHQYMSFRNVFLCSIDPVERNSVTILWIVALHGTALSRYFLRSFLQYFLHGECCTKLSYMNDFCSVYSIFEHCISIHFELHLYLP